MKCGPKEGLEALRRRRVAELLRHAETVLLPILIVAVFIMLWCAGKDNSTVVVCVVVVTIILLLISLGNLKKMKEEK